MSKGSISKNEIPTPEKGIRKMRKKKRRRNLKFNLHIIAKISLLASL
jgi:hypothetical protein